MLLALAEKGANSKLRMLRSGEGMTFTDKSCVCTKSFFTQPDGHILEVEEAIHGESEMQV